MFYVMRILRKITISPDAELGLTSLPDTKALLLTTMAPGMTGLQKWFRVHLVRTVKNLSWPTATSSAVVEPTAVNMHLHANAKLTCLKFL